MQSFLQAPPEDVRKTLLWAAYIIYPFVLATIIFIFAVSPALAHGGAYCGTSERWVTSNGNLYRQDFVEHYANDDHHWRSAEYKYTGTGYTRISDWHHHRTDCGHNH